MGISDSPLFRNSLTSSSFVLAFACSSLSLQSFRCFLRCLLQGGAIEVDAFSQLFQVEIFSFDVAGPRVDRFGTGRGFSKRVFLVYWGMRLLDLATRFHEIFRR